MALWLTQELLADIVVAVCLAYLAIRFVPHPVLAALAAVAILAAPAAIWGYRLTPRIRAWGRRRKQARQRAAVASIHHRPTTTEENV